MPRCFVIQPFDGASFDKRFDEVLVPAIVGAGLEPYRVDRDANATIPIDNIESEIRSAQVCIAEISSDNPNVWLELGFALACNKEVVLLCSIGRSHFPFDIQHRSIIRYKTESPGDFEELKERIIARLKAADRKAASIATLSESPLPATEGLSAHEIVALATIMEGGLDPDSPPSAYAITKDMDAAGFTAVAAAIAVKRLLRTGYIDMTQATNYNGEDYTGFIVTEKGENWLLDNQDKLVLRRGQPPLNDFDDDDLPF